MKFLKYASAVLVFAASTTTHAVIISYGDYTHDDTTDIVTGNGLEWLQWDVTIGESIDSIQSQLNTLDGGGWRIASNTDMAQLYNAFDFGLTFDTDENSSQTLRTGFSEGDPGIEADELFIGMFGDTYGAAGYRYCSGGDCLETANALFGGDADADGAVNRAEVRDDYIASDGFTHNGWVEILSDDTEFTRSYSNYGVALVRDVSAVPVPAAIWLFGSGLIGLVGLARRKKV